MERSSFFSAQAATRQAQWPAMAALALLAASTTPLCAAPKTAPVAKATGAVHSVVRAAPDFLLQGAGKTIPLKKLRGQPVVLIIGPSADSKPVREEAIKLEKNYLQFSAHKTVFVAALTAKPGWVVSNIPFAPAQNGPAVGGAYGITAKDGFGIVVISPEGNIDLQSSRVEASQRVLDIINNSYQRQAAQRTGLGS